MHLSFNGYVESNFDSLATFSHSFLYLFYSFQWHQFTILSANVCQCPDNNEARQIFSNFWGKSDAETRSSINDELRWVYFPTLHLDATAVFRESVSSTQKVVTREAGAEKHWIFPPSAFKCLQTSPSLGWQAHLHAHLRIITLPCTCRQMGAAAAHLSVCNWHIYSTTHTEFKWHTCSWNASWGTLTHTGRLYSRCNMCAGLPPDNSPEIWESNWAQIAGFNCHVGVSTCWRWVIERLESVVIALHKLFLLDWHPGFPPLPPTSSSLP